MLMSVFAWVLISFICFTWGFITCRVISLKQPIDTIPFPSFSIICLAGLAVSGVIGLYISIWFPLNHIVQLLFAIPPVICWLIPAYRLEMTKIIIQAFRFPSRIALLLFILCILMILVISSHYIIHPDTLAYHLQSIIWFENFKAVPGIVHINHLLGFQSLWFCTQAIFRPKFIDGSYVFFLNGAVLCWYIIFICRSLDFKNDSNRWNLAALFLLTFSLLSWTNVRLTAASASPDFIVCIYLLATVYLFLKSDKNETTSNTLIIMFCVTAVLVKLSAVALFILPLYLIFKAFRSGQFRWIVIVILLGIGMMLPILIRNVIASGYPLYPSAIGDISTVRWKQDAEILAELRQYIQLYARIADKDAGDTHWIIIWWNNLSMADKGLIGLLFSLMIISLFRARKIAQHITSRENWLLFTLLSGVALWWLMAPDPRFGIGFLLSLMMLLMSIHLKIYRVSVNRKIIILWAWLIFTGVTVYTGYRFMRFFETNQLIYPAGAPVGNYRTIRCSGIPFNVPLVDTLCKGIPAPCMVDSCTRIQPLGNTIEAGFSSSK